MGAGDLTISDGGSVNSAQSIVGEYADAVGRVRVSGDTSSWTSTDMLVVGSIGIGTLTIDGGAAVSNTSCKIGNVSPAFGPSTGTVSVSGGGTRWTNAGELYVGCNGVGALTVQDGAKVTNTSGYVGYSETSSGTARVTGSGSEWTSSGSLWIGYGGGTRSGTGELIVENGGVVNAGTFYGALSDVRGDGTINAGGLVSDCDLVFDADHGLHKSFAFGTGGALVLDVDADRDLGVGYRGRASLTIGSGVAVSTRYGLLGYNAGSTGTARVTGRDSTWTCYGLGLGVWGTGSLLIDGGATVSNVSTELASYDSSIGAVTITGNGSRLMNTNELYDGISGTGTLTIADGGQATAVKAIIGSNSSMRLYVTGDDMLVVGSALTPGSITSDGTIDLFSDTRLGPGVYQPISEYAGRPITWSGTGSINAYGGTWDNLAGTFTVSAPIELTAGTAQTISAGERMIITDADSGGWISASFGAGSEDASFAGAPIAQSNQSALALLSGDSVLSAWSFTTDLTDARVLLSFDIGQGISNLKVWHFDGANWTPYAPADLYYDSVNGVASFTVDSFSGYAITPEPSALSLIAAAGLLVLRCRRAHAAPTNSAFQPKVGCP